MAEFLITLSASHDESLDPNASGGHRTCIEDRLGTTVPWKASWQQGNWLLLRTSYPWVFGKPRSSGERGIGPSLPEREDSYTYTDGDHILLFPQDESGLCPRSWMEAAWDFVGHFRSAFTFYPEQTLLYSNVTIIGDPSLKPAISPEEAELLGSPNWRTVERINCRSADALAQELNRRIELNTPFLGRST